LDAQNGLTFTGTARWRFSPLSAGSSVLDALWIVAIILRAAGVRLDRSFQTTRVPGPRLRAYVQGQTWERIS
jgi:hypothetical protein